MKPTKLMKVDENTHKEIKMLALEANMTMMDYMKHVTKAIRANQRKKMQANKQ